MKRIFVILAFIVLLFGCTKNQRAKEFGGNITINIPKGNKVTNITWKETNLWYSYRPFQPGEEPVRTQFVEESTFGMWEGTVTFVESK